MAEGVPLDGWLMDGTVERPFRILVYDSAIREVRRRHEVAELEGDRE